MTTAELTSMQFEPAAEAWLESRKPYISAKTHHEYQLNIKTLAGFFGEMKLTEISADMIRAYQKARQAKCGPFSINHECSVLQQMLKRVGRWPDIAWDYEPLRLPTEKRGRVLTDDDKKKLFEVSQEHKDWEAAYLFALISVNTTAGPKEVATLRLKDIDLERRQIAIQPEGAKNPHRVRPIPLNDEAWEGARLAVSRAKRLGACAPHHYVFPYRVHCSKFDPTRYQTTFKTAWKKIIAAAGLPGLRMYDLRHHAITALLENPDVSEETAEAIAGHISHQMKKRYSHIRLEAMRAAVCGTRKDKHSAPVLANLDIIEMLQLGFSNDVIVAKIKASPCAFDTSLEAMKHLKANGVSESAILAMVRSSEATSERTRYKKTA